MNKKQELIDMIYTILWHIAIVCVVILLGASLTGCASRVPAPDTRTDTEKRLDQLEYQQRIQQMNNLLST